MLLASWITLRLIPWLKSKTTRQQQEYLLATTRVLVYAAEQLYGAGKGSVKLSYVEDELERRGLKADASALEAAVREMNLLQTWELALKPEDEENGGDE